MGPHLPRHQKQQRPDPKGLHLPCQKWKQEVTWDPDSAWVDYRALGPVPLIWPSFCPQMEQVGFLSWDTVQLSKNTNRGLSAKALSPDKNPYIQPKPWV